MGCPALGVWVAFLKQPDALPGQDFLFLFFFFFFFGVLHQALCFIKVTQMLDIPFGVIFTSVHAKG
jgi:hypothetical protein